MTRLLCLITSFYVPMLAQAQPLKVQLQDVEKRFTDGLIDLEGFMKDKDYNAPLHTEKSSSSDEPQQEFINTLRMTLQEQQVKFLHILTREIDNREKFQLPFSMFSSLYNYVRPPFEGSTCKELHAWITHLHTYAHEATFLVAGVTNSRKFSFGAPAGTLLKRGSLGN